MTQNGIPKDGDIFKIGDSEVPVDRDGDITIKKKEFRGFEGLWELLKRRRVYKEYVTLDYLRTCKKILLLITLSWRDIIPEVSLMSAE